MTSQYLSSETTLILARVVPIVSEGHQSTANKIGLLAQDLWSDLRPSFRRRQYSIEVIEVVE
jgi:hypothetical protein